MSRRIINSTQKLCAITALVLVSVKLAGLVYATPPSMVLPPRVEIVVTKGKVTHLDGKGDYDNKNQKFCFTVRIKSKEFSRTLENLQVELYVFGKVVTGKWYELLDKASASFSLPAEKEHKFKGNPVELVYDDNKSAQFGVKYTGYLVFVQGQSGNIIAKKGSKKSFIKHIDAFRNMGVGQKFNKQFTLID